MLRRLLNEVVDKFELPILSERSCRRRHIIGLTIHALTASGAIAGLLGLQAIMDGHVRSALIWLIVCQVLDGLDGPIARKVDVVTHAPRFDGHILDLVVDYLTCVVVPVAFMIKMNLLPSPFQMWIAGLIIFTSALWFARNDQETTDNWFNGFPATWNIVVPTFLILGTRPEFAAAISVLLCAVQLTSVKFPHVVRVRSLRRITLTISIIYLISLTYLSADYPNGEPAIAKVLIIVPIYFAFIVIWRTWFPRRSWFGIAPIGE